MKKHVMAIFGTRPEAIKVIPVVKALKSSNMYRVSTVVTGQHREMLDQVLELFKVKPDHDLKIMLAGQSLYDTTCRCLRGLKKVYAVDRPDLVLVQGDTTTTFSAALAAFYENIPVGHIEAGLRSGDMSAPFPEEANRVMTSRLASVHFAPTKDAAANLLNEGLDKKNIFVTGNTVVDALVEIDALLSARSPSRAGSALQKWANGRKIILVTAHRRESWGAGLQSICQAIKDLCSQRPDICFVFSVHRNPAVRRDVHKMLAGITNVRLSEPVGYFAFIELMKLSYLILSDSGGIQEEAPSLKRPVLVLRDVTERPEGIKAGVTKLVGTETGKIVQETLKLLTNEKAYRKMTNGKNPYGDGKASERITKVVRKMLG